MSVLGRVMTLSYGRALHKGKGSVISVAWVSQSLPQWTVHSYTLYVLDPPASTVPTPLLLSMQLYL